jgi:hypothetical protein
VPSRVGADCGGELDGAWAAVSQLLLPALQQAPARPLPPARSSQALGIAHEHARALVARIDRRGRVSSARSQARLAHEAVKARARTADERRALVARIFERCAKARPRARRASFRAFGVGCSRCTDRADSLGQPR